MSDTTADTTAPAAATGDGGASATTVAGPAQRRNKAWALGVCGVVLLGLLFWRGPWGLASAGSSGGSALTSANAAQEGDGGGAIASLLAPPAALPALTTAGANPTDLLAAVGSTSTTDSRLLRIYGLIATSQARQALEEAGRLAADLPNFGLAQLVYADLLTTQNAPTDEFGAVNQPLRAEANERLRELIAEARARVGAAARRPPEGAIPAQFVRLDPSVRHAVAVDVSKSRLYVFENTANGLVIKRDYYSSVGKLGMAKKVEGDLRTPLGVYFVTGRIAEARLRAPAVRDLYGAAALALNYPNQYDQLKGRTGSGIWLHGVASALFSRAPLATDGCVALSNPDLLDLAHFIERQETPILIADQIEWVQPAAALQRHASFMRTFDAWKTARSSADVDAQVKFYANDGRGVAMAAASDAGRGERRRTGPGATTPAPGTATAVEGVSVLSWKDDRDVVVVTFTESSPASGKPRLKRQYWLEQAGTWQVIYEGSLG